MNGFRNSSQINKYLFAFRHKMWFLEGSGLDLVLSCCQEGIAGVSCHPWQSKPLHSFPWELLSNNCLWSSLYHCQGSRSWEGFAVCLLKFLESSPPDLWAGLCRVSKHPSDHPGVTWHLQWDIPSLFLHRIPLNFTVMSYRNGWKETWVSLMSWAGGGGHYCCMAASSCGKCGIYRGFAILVTRSQHLHPG